MKQALLNLMRVTGAFAPFRMANRDKALILTYHRFSKIGGGAATPVRAFAEQLAYLTTHYEIVPLTRLIEYLTCGKSLPPGIAAIAIDDGYRDAYELAFPILRQYNAPATLFVVTEFLDRKVWLWTDKLRFLAMQTQVNEFKTTINHRTLDLTLDGIPSRLEAARQVNEALKQVADDVKEDIILEIAASLKVRLPGSPPDEYAAITWQQAREMDAAGITIGSHTTTHPILTQVSDERLRSELCESRRRIEMMLGRDADLFCYPNGDFDDRVSRAVRAAGYKCAVTIEAGFNGADSDLLTLRRVHTQDNFARFMQCTSGFDQTRNRLARVSPQAISAHRRRPAAGQ